MKLASSAFLTFCVILLFVPAKSGAQASPAPTATPATVFVPKGATVVIKTTEALSSYAASPREPLSFAVVQDLIVNGYVVAKAGDDVEGRVLEAQQGRAGYYGIGYKAADLRIDAEVVHNFCGDPIKLQFIRSEYRRRQGLFGSKKDVEVVDGQKYVAATAYPEKVCGQATSATPAPVPADALPADHP